MGWLSKAVGTITGAISDVGKSIDKAVNDVIPGGWGTVAAATAIYFGIPPATFAPEAAAAATAAEVATAATVPSAFEAATAGALGGGSTLGAAGPVGTAGFGTALPSAANVAAGLETAGLSAGTAANLAGMTAAGIGATNLLGGATALAPIAASPAIGIQEVLRGARLVNQLLTPQQQQFSNLLNQAQQNLAQQGTVDYSTLLGLLSQKSMQPGLLGTQFQPQTTNIASLLG